MTQYVAYHGLPHLKATVLAELEAHREADTLTKGWYWGGGKGCAVGCLTRDVAGGHVLFPAYFGIPVAVAYLIDRIFEVLPAPDHLDWPHRVMSAIPVGADLSGIEDACYRAWSEEDWSAQRLPRTATGAALESPGGWHGIADMVVSQIAWAPIPPHAPQDYAILPWPPIPYVFPEGEPLPQPKAKGRTE